MARNKECLIAILDIRENANCDFKDNSVKCVAEIIKDKISNNKKDYVSFILLGSDQTDNDLNSQVSQDDYMNIVQYPEVLECSWKLLIDYYKFVNQTACKNGEWLESIVMAMQLIRKCEETCKFKRSRIVLFYDCNDSPNNYEQIDVITENLKKLEIDLIIVSSNIFYINDTETDEIKPIFANNHKTFCQLENEKQILSLAKDCEAKLCNLTEALNVILKTEIRSPFPWNAVLTIGTEIRIYITGVIAVKDDSKIPLKKCWATEDKEVTRELKQYNKGEEVHPLPMDIVDGYMLGATPIPYEKIDDDDEESPEKGLKFLGFTKRKSIQDEYYCGNSTYLITHQKGVAQAARILESLVRAMLKMDMAMICNKIYSEKFNKMKLVVLLPNEIKEGQPASLSMIEHTFYEQNHYYNFPALTTEANKCTAKQLEAIDELIDSMDLMIDPKEVKRQPRERMQCDLLPYDSLPNIFEQNLLDIIERKVILNASQDDEQFQEMLKDKNFVEKYWKVPEQIEEQAKIAANKVKNVFPLENGIIQPHKLKSKKVPSTQINENPMQQLDFNKVREANPANDFQQLIEYNVNTIKDRTCQDAKYHEYVEQIKLVIWNLLKKPKFECDLIGNALKVLRENCIKFNSINVYNQFIRNLKEFIIEQNYMEFWTNYIIKMELGLCFIGELSIDEKFAQTDFYEIMEMETEVLNELNDDEMNDVLASMET